MQSDRRSAGACPPSRRDESWRDQALCAQADPEVFFPERGGSPRAARRVCARCPVRRQCLQWALENDERYGIWGGLTEDQRQKLRRSAHAAGHVDEDLAP